MMMETDFFKTIADLISDGLQISETPFPKFNPAINWTQPVICNPPFAKNHKTKKYLAIHRGRCYNGDIKGSACFWRAAVPQYDEQNPPLQTGSVFTFS
jgi:hypothetical protein